MNLTAKIAFEEIGVCPISRYIVKNLLSHLTASKIADLTKLSLNTVNYYRKSDYCIQENKKITGYVYVNFNHLTYLNQVAPDFNVNHYCILSMLHSHKFKISDSYIKEKLNLANYSLIAESKTYTEIYEASIKKLKSINQNIKLAL